MKITEYMGNKVCTFQTVIEEHKVTIEFMFMKLTKEIVDYSIRINGNPSLATRNNINKLAEEEMKQLLNQLVPDKSITKN